MVALGRDLPTAYATGAALIAASVLFIYINVRAIKSIACKKENLRLSAYGFMIVLSVANVAQLVSEAISGLFLFTQSDWNIYFDKAVAGNLDAAFDVYCAFVVLLAINRLVAVLFPIRYHFWFSHSSMKFWYFLAFLIWAVDFALFVSPIRSLTFDFDTISFKYNESPAMRRFNMCISLGGFSTSTAIYVIIYVALAIRRGLNAKKMTASEKNVLLQTAFIAGFELATTLFWWLPFLPKDEVAQLFFQFVWLSNAVVSPIAYFALRSRNAKTSERGTGTLTAVG